MGNAVLGSVQGTADPRLSSSNQARQCARGSKLPKRQLCMTIHVLIKRPPPRDARVLPCLKSAQQACGGGVVRKLAQRCVGRGCNEVRWCKQRQVALLGSCRCPVLMRVVCAVASAVASTRLLPLIKGTAVRAETASEAEGVPSWTFLPMWGTRRVCLLTRDGTL